MVKLSQLIGTSSGSPVLKFGVGLGRGLWQELSHLQKLMDTQAATRGDHKLVQTLINQFSVEISASSSAKQDTAMRALSTFIRAINGDQRSAALWAQIYQAFLVEMKKKTAPAAGGAPTYLQLALASLAQTHQSVPIFLQSLAPLLPNLPGGVVALVAGGAKDVIVPAANCNESQACCWGWFRKLRTINPSYSIDAARHDLREAEVGLDNSIDNADHVIKFGQATFTIVTTLLQATKLAYTNAGGASTVVTITLDACSAALGATSVLMAAIASARRDNATALKAEVLATQKAIGPGV